MFIKLKCLNKKSNVTTVNDHCYVFQMKTTWSHRLTPNDLTSTMTTTWGSDKRMQIDVSGTHVTGSLSASVAVQTPWAVARDLRAETKNQYGAGKVASSSSVKVSRADNSNCLLDSWCTEG